MSGSPAPAITTGVPEPDKILSYSSSNYSLFLYGDPASSKMALLCPGFPDDQTVFQPFAKALSEKGGLLVGVMCLPGFDDTEKAPWTSHKLDGYSYDEMTQAVREASKALKAACTHKSPELTGIFHDWGVFPGTLWASRLEEEAKDVSDPSVLVIPDKLVFLDVLLGPSPNAKDIPTNIEKLSTKQAVTGTMYQMIFAAGFLVQRYISRPLAPFLALPPLLFMAIFGLMPTYEFDGASTVPLYGDKKVGWTRLIYMMYPYWYLFKLPWLEKNWGTGIKALPTLHQDWKSTPILYLFGKKKKTQFHNFATIKMLEREETEKTSLCRTVGLEDAGHYLFVQKQEECLEEVLDFVNAENTFVS